MKYDLTHLAMVGEDGIPVFLIPSATPDKNINDKRKKERGEILRAFNSHEALVEFVEKVSRSACLNQRVGDKCICFSCEANRLKGGK